MATPQRSPVPLPLTSAYASPLVINSNTQRVYLASSSSSIMDTQPPAASRQNLAAALPLQPGIQTLPEPDKCGFCTFLILIL